MDDQFNKCEAIIVKLSKLYSSRFSRGTLYDLEDLISEGWVIYLKCKKKEHDIKVEFTTYLYVSVENNLKTLYRDEYIYRKRKHYKVELDGLDFDSSKLSPERALMALQAVIALSEVSYDFATMVVNGVPKDLLFVARRHMRGKKLGSNSDKIGENILYPKHLLEDFFNVNIDNLRILVSKYF